MDICCNIPILRTRDILIIIKKKKFWNNGVYILADNSPGKLSKKYN